MKEIEQASPEHHPFTFKGYGIVSLALSKADYFIMPRFGADAELELHLKLWVAGRKLPLWLLFYDTYREPRWWFRSRAKLAIAWKKLIF